MRKWFLFCLLLTIAQLGWAQNTIKVRKGPHNRFSKIEFVPGLYHNPDNRFYIDTHYKAYFWLRPDGKTTWFATTLSMDSVLHLLNDPSINYEAHFEDVFHGIWYQPFEDAVEIYVRNWVINGWYTELTIEAAWCPGKYDTKEDQKPTATGKANDMRLLLIQAYDTFEQLQSVTFSE